MRALLKKEFREQLLVGLIAFVVALLLCVVYAQMPDITDQVRHDEMLSFLRLLTGGIEAYTDGAIPVSLINPVFLAFFGVLCLAAGVVLGGLAAWRENSGKTWAFLVHRPVTRGRVVGAKMLVAGVLYFAALGIPVVGLTLWSAVPGHIPAPWSWCYVYGVVEKLVIGYMFIPAAFLCYIRPDARWYGSRYLPGLAVAAAAVLQNAWMSFPSVLIVVGAYILLNFRAIHYCFVRKEGVTGRFSLVFILTVGLTACSIIVIMMSLLVLQPVFRKFAEHNDVRYTSYQISEEGRFERVVEYNTKNSSIEDLEGNVIRADVPEDDPEVGGMTYMYKSPYQSLHWSPRLRESVLSVVDEQRHGRVGYLFKPENMVYVYDWYKRKPVQFWGRNGIFKERSEAEPFDELYVADRMYCWNQLRIASDLYLSAKSGLYAVTDTYGIVPVRTERTFDFGIAFPVAPYERYLLFTREEDRIVLSGPLGEHALEYPLPDECNRCRGLEIRYLTNGVLGVVAEFHYNTDDFDPNRGPDAGFYLIDTNGIVQKQADYSAPTRHTDVDDYVGNVMIGVNPMLSAMVLGSVVLDRPASMRMYSVKDMLNDFDSIVFRRLVPFILLYGLVCGLSVGWMLKRRGQPLRVLAGWSVLAFIGGLPTLLALRFVLMDEKLLRCASCGKKRVPSQAKCSRCGAGWPLPAVREIDLMPDA